VGKAFADNDSVVVAKIDATANDIPDTNKFKVRMSVCIPGAQVVECQFVNCALASRQLYIEPCHGSHPDAPSWP